jgi:methionine-rich copper-binding protein CopC
MKLNLISLGLLVSLLTGPAALAHDDVIDQVPAPGSSVEAGPLDIKLDFSNELLDLGSGAEVVVTAPDGSIAPATCAVLDGTLATAKTELDQAGTYTIAWRVVSSDGHPIEGSYEFELLNSSGYVASGNIEPCLIATSGETQEDSTNYWLLFGSLGLAAAGLFLYLRPRKPRSSN